MGEVIAAPFVAPAPVRVVPSTIEIEIATIDAADRLRQVDPDIVAALAASFNEVGHRTPIIVRSGEGNRALLVAGAHRLAAAKLLGWQSIRAEFLDLDAQQARLVEIDENLIRAELTALDRALFLVERKRIYELLHPETVHGGDRKSTRKMKPADQVANLATWSRFSTDAAEKTGLSERSVQRACELATALSPDAIALIRGTKLADNAAQLKALADIDPVEQVKVARAVADGAVSVTAARVAAGLVPEGGAIREEDRPLARIEPMLLRLSHQQLLTLRAMVDARIEATAPRRKGRAS